ncbi:hypothetical protein [Yokenella regensburgei]|uniref:hypothetical protein n=1 Tax=Yokenella regensburgei TaxID=158877 RepID=UPI003ED8966E
MTTSNETMNGSELEKKAMEELDKCLKHPKIGAVVSKDGVLLSTGFRDEVIGKHAERVAIEKLSIDQLRGLRFIQPLSHALRYMKGNEKNLAVN